MKQEQAQISRKLRVLYHAEETGNVSLTCRYYGISRKTYYDWLNSYHKDGESGLINKNPCPINMPLRTPPEIEEKIIYIRKNYHFGQQRISTYLLRYHGIKIAGSTVRMVLVRNGLIGCLKTSDAG